jgi:RF-1 domain
MRDAWTSLTDRQLLAQCAVDTYRASGPGGQKRNKTSSAVRIRHPPSGLIVIAEESRSQHQNRAKALERLRQAFYLKTRTAIGPEELQPSAIARREGYQGALDKSGRLDMGKRDARFWPAVGVVLDVLEAKEARVSETASVLGISTANLLAFLQISPKAWEQTNILRTRFGRKTLHS